MNIEEERKAFKQYTGQDSNVYNHEFGYWLKAKKHAEEMAKKPVICSENIGGRFGVYHPGALSPIVKSFATAEEAKVWAVNNGYRVVEE